jgi:methylmalonyl-CoA mutase cobalamin-binding domain/chain
MVDFDLIQKNMSDLEEDDVLASMQEIMDAGGSDATKALDALQAGMQEVGDRFETGTYFLGDLIYAADIMSSSLDIIKPALAAGAGTGKGKVILATVKGDVHDIGKNIVKGLLESGGFEVVDLGIDIPAEKIVETAKNEKIGIVALSGVLTLALTSMTDVVEAFRAAGIRDDVKIIIGGNPVTEEAFKVIGADAWTRSPQKAVTICTEWASM